MNIVDRAEKSANFSLADRLKQVRKAKGFTQKDVCSLLNIEIGTLSGYEIGRRSPSTSRLLELAKVYGVSTDYLLGNTNDPTLKSIPKEISIEEAFKLPGFLKYAKDEIVKIQKAAAELGDKSAVDAQFIGINFDKIQRKDQIRLLESVFEGVLISGDRFVLKPIELSKEAQEWLEKIKKLPAKDQQAVLKKLKPIH